MNRDEKYALIEQHWPDALLNPEPEFMDEPEIRYALTDIVGFCGCGCPDMAAAWLRDLLLLLDTSGASTDWDARCAGLKAHWAKVTTEEYGPLFYLVMYWIGHQEWTEHGGSVGGSWLTDKGRAAIVALELLIEAEEREG